MADPRPTRVDKMSPLTPKVSAALPKRRRRTHGRPANASSADTRHEILTAARECFAAYGYAATTNKIIADRTGLTPATVYHHFGRKSDLMLAVFNTTEAESFARMRTAIDAQSGAIARIGALLDATHEILSEDRSKAVFMFVVREEAQRHAELSAISFDRVLVDLSTEIIDQAIEDRELAAEDAKLARGAIAAMTLGLAGLGSNLSADAHQLATEGCKRLVIGSLFKRSTQ